MLVVFKHLWIRHCDASTFVPLYQARPGRGHCPHGVTKDRVNDFPGSRYWCLRQSLAVHPLTTSPKDLLPSPAQLTPTGKPLLRHALGLKVIMGVLAPGL